MKCLQKYKWVKLPREEIPAAKGRMGSWLRLTERAAFRKGISTYCGHKNPVEPGMWSGGIVGLKSILGVRSREKALEILNDLKNLGYLTYTLDADTRKLTYRIADWVVECSGEECMDGAVYTTPKYGFLCMPRNITQRLAEQGLVFDEAAAWLDLWCHTVFQDQGNAFSFLAPAIQYGKYGSILTLETLGKRWGWEKTKVWRFFRKYAPYFYLCRLPGSYGCVIFNRPYPVCDEITTPEEDTVISIFREIRIRAQNTHTAGTKNEKANRFTAWKSRRLLEDSDRQEEYGEAAPNSNASDSSVALSALYNARVSFSYKNCKNCRNCIYAWEGNYKGLPESKIGTLYPFAGLDLILDEDKCGCHPVLPDRNFDDKFEGITYFLA